MKKDIRTLAALLIASAAFVACSSDNDIISENQQPANGKYTMTINASKGDGTTTRALTLDETTSPHELNATWALGENVYVQKAGAWATGSLQPQADGATATLKGELSGITINADDNLTLQFPKSGDITYAGQQGTIADIQANFDWATATVEVESVSPSGNINPKTATTTFTNQQAIIKFTLKDKGNSDAAISPTALTVTDGTSTVELTSIPAATYTANGADNVLYVAFPAAGSAKTVTLTATVGDDTYTYEKSGVTFTNGQYYEITVKMTKQAPAPAPTLADAFTDDAVVTVKVNTANSQWFGVTGTYTSGTYATTGIGSVLSPSSVSMTKDGSNLVVTVTNSWNTYTVKFNSTDNTYMENATSSTLPWRMTELQSITINGVDITSQLTASPSETISLVNMGNSIEGTNFDVAGQGGSDDNGKQVDKWNNLTITAKNSKTIKEVALSYGSLSQNAGTLSASPGSYDGTNTITGINASSLTISSSSPAGVYISSVKIYY